MTPEEQAELLGRLDERSKNTLGMVKGIRDSIKDLPTKDQVTIEIESRVKKRIADCNEMHTKEMEDKAKREDARQKEREQRRIKLPPAKYIATVVGSVILILLTYFFGPAAG